MVVVASYKTCITTVKRLGSTATRRAVRLDHKIRIACSHSFASFYRVLSSMFSPTLQHRSWLSRHCLSTLTFLFGDRPASPKVCITYVGINLPVALVSSVWFCLLGQYLLASFRLKLSYFSFISHKEKINSLRIAE